jgi:hypothetical protein
MDLVMQSRSHCRFLANPGIERAEGLIQQEYRGQLPCSG